MKYEGLAPCPFCRSALHLRPSRRIKRTYYNDFGSSVLYGTFYVRCMKCNARGPVVGGLFSSTTKEATIYGKKHTVETERFYFDLAKQAWDKCWAFSEGGPVIVIERAAKTKKGGDAE